MKERTNTFWKTLNFLCSLQFLRMAFLWTFQVIYSYFTLRFLEFFSRSSPSYPRCHPNITNKRRPVCVITGATSGLGAAAARALSREGFYVVLVSKVQIEDETLFGSPALHKTYPCAQVYESAKFCLVLFTYELNRQLNLVASSTQVSVMAADPGAVATNIMRELPSHLSFLAQTALKLLRLLQSPEDGVNSIIDAALAPPEVSGAYFFGGRGRTLSSSSLSYDIKLAGKLWSRSCNLFLPKLRSYTEL